MSANKPLPTLEELAQWRAIHDEMEQRQNAAPGYPLDLEQAARDLATFIEQHYRKKDWTTKHAAEAFATWFPHFVMRQAFRSLAKAIHNASIVSGKDAILRAAYQAEGAHRSLFNEALQHREQLLDSLDRRQKDGRKGKGAPRTHGHKWADICADYDRWCAEGVKRPIIIRRLANKYETSQAIINRGLRDRGRGATPRQAPTSNT